LFTNKLQSNITFLLILSCFILNSGLISNLLIFILLLSLIIINSKNYKLYFFLKLFFILICFISFLNSLFYIFDYNQFFKFLILIILVIFYPFKYTLTKNHAKVLILTIIYLVIMQIGNALGITLFVNFIDKFYPISENLWDYKFDSTNISEIISNRLAGIYYNPNIMGQSLVFLYAIILDKLNISFTKKTRIYITILIFVSILLTGGRTALITFIILLGLNHYRYFKKYIFLFIPIIVLFIAYIVTTLQLRAFENIFNPLAEDDSGNAKLQILISYFRDFNFNSISTIFTYLFGYLNWDRQFDSDIGYLLSFIGIFGFLYLIFILIYIYRKTVHSNRYYFVLLLITITATIFLNLRFSILFFLIISKFNKQLYFNDET
jgi:hypothetical protein